MFSDIKITVYLKHNLQAAPENPVIQTAFLAFKVIVMQLVNHVFGKGYAAANHIAFKTFIHIVAPIAGYMVCATKVPAPWS